MRDVDLFQMALDLESPWYVDRTEFDVEEKRLDLYPDFRQGGRFTCPECGKGGCPAHDTTEKTWRHLDFFQHEAFLHPRVSCDGCDMKLVGEHDSRLWRVIHHYVGEARAEVSHEGVHHLGVDETSLRRGHEYLTIFVDLDESQVPFATEGRESDTFRAFTEDLEAHGGRGDWIREVCMDMSPAYRKGLRDHLSRAKVTFDRFHVVKLLNEAVDLVRRAERKEAPELSRTRYLWLRNTSSLSQAQQRILDSLLLQHTHLRTVKAYQMKLAFQDFWALPAGEASRFLRAWCRWAKDSELEPMTRFARTVEAHRDGILRRFQTRISNGLLEGLSSLIQAAKTRARGYRSTRNFIPMIYLMHGKLPNLRPI